MENLHRDIQEVRSFYLMANEQKDPGYAYARRLKAYLNDMGLSAVLRGEDSPVPPTDTQAALVIGGDGTLLRAARELVDLGIPLLGINLGTLGYLAELEPGNVKAAIDRLVRGAYTIEKRMMLKGSVRRKGEWVMHETALNDVVLFRSGKLRVLDFRVYVDNAFLCSYRADGMILATPMGSTGYSLSAGGPIVAPGAELIVMTAIAPHTLSNRAVILPEHVSIRVEVGGTDRQMEEGEAEISFDGAAFCSAGKGDCVEVTRSEQHLNLIKVSNTSFIENLRTKMN